MKEKTLQHPALHGVSHKTSFHQWSWGTALLAESHFFLLFSFLKSPYACALYLEVAEHMGDVQTIMFLILY